ncbi:hypothetical protein B0H19DRAFT_1084639 [Mycena capillaripes]|nr:hypothetical protein B0H19DRAFT_1084639 [Mycena capillaripes]
MAATPASIIRTLTTTFKNSPATGGNFSGTTTFIPAKEVLDALPSFLRTTNVAGGQLHGLPHRELVVQPGSKVFYELGSLPWARVGFLSAGVPTTLSEAVWSPVVGWQLAQLD